MVQGQPRAWLHMEGLAALILSILLYSRADTGWLLFAVLLFAPDLSMLGYLSGARIGATVYNAAHSYVLPALLAAGALLWDQRLALSLALIWTAHIGFDRLLGYGLKYSNDFTETHLGRIGRRRKREKERA